MKTFLPTSLELGGLVKGLVEMRCGSGHIPVLVVIHLGGGAEGSAGEAGDEEGGGGGTHFEG